MVQGMEIMETNKIVTVMTEICQIKSTERCILISLLLQTVGVYLILILVLIFF